MTVQDLYNILEKEVDAGRLTLESNVRILDLFNNSVTTINNDSVVDKDLYLTIHF